MDEGPVRRLLERGEATEDDLARVGGDRGVGPREGVERRQLARPGIAHIETVVLGRGVPFGHRTRDEELGGRQPGLSSTLLSPVPRRSGHSTRPRTSMIASVRRHPGRGSHDFR